jgi:hypothetical protein
VAPVEVWISLETFGSLRHRSHPRAAGDAGHRVAAGEVVDHAEATVEDVEQRLARRYHWVYRSGGGGR